MFRHRYACILQGSRAWRELPTGDGLTFAWAERSEYIRRPPYFDTVASGGRDTINLQDLRPLAMLGDSITTDHISPSSVILPDSAAGQYLLKQGTREADFNSYGTRRGNFEIVARATFASHRLRNHMLEGQAGSFTSIRPDGVRARIYDAAQVYRQRGEGLIVIAGKEYGCGSSRDTAAKGPWLLGIHAVLAESFERIHRSNLVAMGIVPLEFMHDQNAAALGLTGHETYSVDSGGKALKTGMTASLGVQREDGTAFSTRVRVRLDTEEEIRHFSDGGILPRLYRRIAKT